MQPRRTSRSENVARPFGSTAHARQKCGRTEARFAARRRESEHHGLHRILRIARSDRRARVASVVVQQLAPLRFARRHLPRALVKLNETLNAPRVRHRRVPARRILDEVLSRSRERQRRQRHGTVHRAASLATLSHGAALDAALRLMQVD